MTLEDYQRQMLSPHIAADQLAALEVVTKLLKDHGAAAEHLLLPLLHEITATAEQDKTIGRTFAKLHRCEHSLSPELYGALIRLAIRASGANITEPMQETDDVDREHD